MASGRCPECGLAVDFEQLRESGVPWAHRRRIGRVRAFVRTVWWFTIGSQRLAMESAKPQAWEDARSFARIIAAAMAGLLLAGFAALLRWGGGYAVLTVEKPSSPWLLGPGGRTPWWAQGPWLDVVLPWCAGAMLYPVLPVCLIALAASLPAIWRAMVDGREVTDAQRHAGVPLLTYAMSPLMWLWPAAGLFLVATQIVFWSAGSPLEPWADVLEQIVGLSFTGLLLTALAGAVGRPMQWYARVTHRGAGSAMLAGAGWGLRLLLAVVFWLGVVPWCVGFAWLAIDSFRR